MAAAEMYGKPRPMFERSAEVGWLIAALKDAPEDGISYEDLSEVCGEDVKGNAKHLLYSARRILEKEERILFSCRRGWGLVKLDDNGVLGCLEDTRKRIGSAARRGRSRSKCVNDVNGLPPPKRAELLAKQSLFSLIEVSTKEKKVKIIEEKIKPIQKMLDLGQMLDAIKKTKGKNKDDDDHSDP